MNWTTISIPTLLISLQAGPGIAQQPATSPQAGVRLVYTMPVDALQRSLQGNTNDDLEKLLNRSMEAMITTLRERLGEQVAVVRAGATDFVVDLPAALAVDLPSVRRRIKTLGTLDLRIVASNDYERDDVHFDLEAEQQRLYEWLATGGRARILADATAIRTFEPAAGSSRLRWVVRRVKPKASDAGQWDVSFTRIPGLREATVALFRDADWNDGKVPAALAGDRQPQLIEFVAVNLHEPGFDQRDLDTEHTLAEAGPFGPRVQYAIVPLRDGDYAAWSEKHVGHCCAIISNGEILSAPKFVARIPGRGVIEGSFTEQETKDMVAALRGGALPAPPKLLRQEALPTTGK